MLTFIKNDYTSNHPHRFSVGIFIDKNKSKVKSQNLKVVDGCGL